MDTENAYISMELGNFIAYVFGWLSVYYPQSSVREFSRADKAGIVFW